MEFNPGLGGVRDVASAISSNEHSVKMSLLFFQTLDAYIFRLFSIPFWQFDQTFV